MVPFVAKVVESCAESRVFKPPNPWTMGIMAVLSELHSLPNLKVCGRVIGCTCRRTYVCYEVGTSLSVVIHACTCILSIQLNLRFEIEVLCKHLLLEISVSHACTYVICTYVRITHNVLSYLLQDVSPCKLIGDTEKLKNIIPQLGIKSILIRVLHLDVYIMHKIALINLCVYYK